MSSFSRHSSKLVLTKIQGVDVNEVCEIFERINQEGKKLDPVDIIVARTYRNEDLGRGIKGFYLRDYLRQLQEALSSQGNRFTNLADLTTIQMVSVMNVTNAMVFVTVMPQTWMVQDWLTFWIFQSL